MDYISKINLCKSLSVNSLITKADYKEFIDIYYRQQQRIKELLAKVKDYNIGIDLTCDCDSYYPCDFIEIVDEEDGIVKVYESSTNKYHIVCVLDLYIDDKNDGMFEANENINSFILPLDNTQKGVIINTKSKNKRII